MLVLVIEPHHMSKYQPILIVCCGEQQERCPESDPSEGPEGLGLTLIYSRSTKKRAMGEMLSSVGVYMLQSAPYQLQPHTVLAG
jgi:hypothetical protein